MKRSRQKVSEVSAAVYIVVVLFSMSTWMDVVGVWIEMPLFVTTLPEGWSLPSYLVIIIQLANVAPAIYAIIQKFQKGTTKMAASSEDSNKTMKRFDTEVVLTLVILIITALNVFLLSFLWPITGFIGGRRHSIVMLAQMVPAALTSCMTSLVFLPYMARFPSRYISAYYVGQGFSGLVPGVLGLIQGAGSAPVCRWNSTQFENNTLGNVTDDIVMNTTAGVIIESQKPLFSVKIFFFCLTAFFLVSLAAFCCLNFTKCARSAMVGHAVVTDTAVLDESGRCEGQRPAGAICETAVDSHGPLCHLVHADHETVESAENEPYERLNREGDSEKPDYGTADASESADQGPASREKAADKMPKRTFVWILIVIGVVNALSNGVLPSTESYTCLPYGYLVYTLAVRLSSVAASLASLSSMFLPQASVKSVTALTLVGIVIATFHLILAAQSPDPVLRGYVLGDIIVVSKSARICLYM